MVAIIFVEESLLSRNSIIAEEITSHFTNKPQNKFPSKNNVVFAEKKELEKFKKLIKKI